MKEIQLTETVKQAIRKIAGEDANFDNLAVFEVTAVNSLPLDKRGTLFEGGRITRATLQEVANHINTRGLHLHTLHRAGYELPVGRVFLAEVVENELDTEVRALFFLPRDTRADLIADINSGTLDEVSIGMLPKRLLCSECGWDFLGEDATFTNRYMRTCDNGHTIGEDGVFANISGITDAYELSLVSRGAAQNAKILSRTKTLLAQDSMQRLAADGRPVEAAFLYATKTEGNLTMKLSASALGTKVREAVLASFTASATDASLLEAATTATKGVELEAGVNSEAVLTDILGALKAEFTALSKGAGKDEAEKSVTTSAASTNDPLLLSQLIDLKADNKLLQGQIADRDAQIAQLQADAKEANKPILEFLQAQAKQAQVATGVKDPVVPETLDACVELIKQCSLNLANLFSAGGVSRGADVEDNSGSDKAPANFDAFRPKSR